jgi:prephenate dehydratase
VTHRVAYQGVPGSFSEQASRGFAGDAATLLPCVTFAEAFDALAEGRADRAALPVENTLAGTVRDVAAGLATRAVEIEAESRLRVSHALVAPPGVTMDRVRRVRSHPVALQQCERFLRAHPAMTAEADFDTAGALERVLHEARGDAAAIASERAAALLGGVVLARELEDDPANFTRFLLLARAGEGVVGAGARKTTVRFTAPHRPGALHACLGVFAARGLDLTRIESHPVAGRPFEYAFLADLVAPDGAALDAALADLVEVAAAVRRLGTYAPAEDARPA